jgi:hypothetical protein
MSISPGLLICGSGRGAMLGLTFALPRDVGLRWLVPGYRPQLATRGDRTRAVAAAMATLAAGLRKAA